MRPLLSAAMLGAHSLAGVSLILTGATDDPPLLPIGISRISAWPFVHDCQAIQMVPSEAVARTPSVSGPGELVRRCSAENDEVLGS